MMLALQEINPNRHELGNLCKRNHEWQGTGKSLRFKHNWLCIMCKRENHHSRKQDIEYIKKRRDQNKKARAKYLAENPKANIKAVVKYNKRIVEGNEYFALVSRLRSRVNRAFNEYTKLGKIRTSREYGIDYKAIIEHLGKCPGNRKDYHIDHIIPITAFDLNDVEQVKLAFAPENHQWLKCAENIRKGGASRMRQQGKLGTASSFVQPLIISAPKEIEK
jgi:hypothetical protein